MQLLKAYPLRRDYSVGSRCNTARPEKQPDCFYFFLKCFGGPEVLLFIYSSAVHQRTAYSEVAIPEGSPFKGWKFTVGNCRIQPEAAGLQSGVATSEPPLLPDCTLKGTVSMQMCAR
jgi:hypothetical protein